MPAEITDLVDQPQVDEQKTEGVSLNETPLFKPVKLNLLNQEDEFKKTGGFANITGNFGG